jgi:hypothetical protein
MSLVRNGRLQLPIYKFVSSIARFDARLPGSRWCCIVLLAIVCREIEKMRDCCWKPASDAALRPLGRRFCRACIASAKGHVVDRSDVSDAILLFQQRLPRFIRSSAGPAARSSRELCWPVVGSAKPAEMIDVTTKLPYRPQCENPHRRCGVRMRNPMPRAGLSGGLAVICK